MTVWLIAEEAYGFLSMVKAYPNFGLLIFCFTPCTLSKYLRKYVLTDQWLTKSTSEVSTESNNYVN